MRHVPSSPYFFKRIKTASLLFVVFCFFYSLFFPQKVDNMAQVNSSPNPAKAPWFFLWIQELMGYSSYFVYLLIGILFTMFFLPYIFPKQADRARWFLKDQRFVNIFVLILQLGILLLTFLGLLRGENWELKGF